MTKYIHGPPTTPNRLISLNPKRVLQLSSTSVFTNFTLGAGKRPKLKAIAIEQVQRILQKYWRIKMQMV